MLRRKPTRLELKIDDTEEFESVKKELEVQSTPYLFRPVWFRPGHHVCSVFRPGNDRERRLGQELEWAGLLSLVLI